MNQKVTKEEKEIVKIAINRFKYDLGVSISNHKDMNQKEKVINDVRDLESFEKKLEKL